MPEQQPTSLVRTLASSLWFPLFFILGFVLCYLLPFHAPAPHHVPVVAVGEQLAQQLDAKFAAALPGGVDVTAVPDAAAAKEAITDREAVAAYDPASGQLFYAKANGAALVQFLQQMFAPVAAATGHALTPVDLVPTAAGDVMGTGLFYLLLAMNIPPYVTVMVLLRAELTTRQKLLCLVGVGAFAAVVCYSAGRILNVIPPHPIVLLLGFMLTQAVGWTTFGLVPLVKQFIPGVAMSLFVLLSMPSSGGAIPKELVPPFFQFFHLLLPLGQAADSIRGVLYFDGARSWPGITGLAVWCAIGVGLTAATQWHAKRKRENDPEAVAEAGSYEHRDDGDAIVDPTFEPPRPAHHRTLAGTIRLAGDLPARGAVVTVTDAAGNQLARVDADVEGWYEVHDLPDRFVTVVAAAPGAAPAASRVSVPAGRSEHDFALTPTASGARR
ncbi:ABC transporter permease [Saccharopolyspora sp. 6V]|uniref:ABC transporter permease n=1 Tax=Saccharopolyspora sp. 6V TaxID=2877239 RepID=UPI001CD6E7EF|nr:ABC transporter permease [Saccharopolyspora sp. 6V]MCA1190559.1 ABC transporter permease [Saccharopolyspora sp. 6V]